MKPHVSLFFSAKGNVDSHKSELECEALEFLISLNLSVDDIYSLKVIGEVVNYQTICHFVIVLK